jgi:hypothetical protein
MKLLIIVASVFLALQTLPTYAQDVPPVSDEDFLVEEGTPSEYALPLGETEMEKADLERQEDIMSPDDANTDWNMDDVAQDDDF